MVPALILWLPLLTAIRSPENGQNSADEWLLAGAIVIGAALFMFSKGRKK